MKQSAETFTFRQANPQTNQIRVHRNGAAARRSPSLHACQREGRLLNRAYLLRRSEYPRSVHSSDGQLSWTSQRGNVQSKVRAQVRVPPEPRQRKFFPPRSDSCPLPRETGWTPLPSDALCSDVRISASPSLKWQSICKIRLNSNHKCTEAVNLKRVELQQAFRNTMLPSHFSNTLNSEKTAKFWRKWAVMRCTAQKWLKRAPGGAILSQDRAASLDPATVEVLKVLQKPTYCRLSSSLALTVLDCGTTKGMGPSRSSLSHWENVCKRNDAIGTPAHSFWIPDEKMNSLTPLSAPTMVCTSPEAPVQYS